MLTRQNAGNHGDVLKHVLLQMLVTSKLECHEKGFVVLDTHAGNDIYDIVSDEKGSYAKGASSGVAKVLEKLNDENMPQPLHNYIELAQRFDRKHRREKEYLCIIDPPYEKEHERIEILEAV
jgi:23S rRNA (adenine2030-N6)-methyltransferase